MNHIDALQSNTAEKYLLGELTAAERAEYEEHYFGCQECAEDVKAGAVLLDNARQVLRLEFRGKEHAVKSTAEQHSWFGWFRPAYALAAVALLAAAIIYQNVFTIPSLRREVAANVPQSLPSFSFVTLGSRSNASLTVNTDLGSPFGLYVDIPASDAFRSYTCRVRSESGSSVFAVNVSPEQARDTVQLLIPGSTLKPANYALIIEGHRAESGAGAQEIAHYAFVVQAK
jgi:hypothetical protein